MRQSALGIDPPALSFEDGAGLVHVDLVRLVAGRLVASASSGGGKGWLGRWICEATCERIPQLVVDWEGEYPSLKSVHPYVWVGDPDDGADLPVSEGAARPQCRALAGAGASVVLDLSSLGVDARRRAAGLWMDELTARRAPSPRLVLVDEAHELAPQGGDVDSSAALKRLVSLGRKRGLGAVLLTQRLSKLHKDVAEAANRMIGRTILDVDVRRSAEELGMGREASQALKRLRPGQWYAFGPAVHDGEGVVLCRAGETRSAYPDGTLANIAVPTPAEIAKALQGLARESEGRVAEDAGRAELLEEIERLRAQVKSLREGNVSEPADIARAVSAATEPLRGLISTLELRVERCRHHAAAIFLGLGEMPPDAPAPEPLQTSAASETAALGGYEAAILDALAAGERSRDELAAAVGAASRRSSKFRAAVGALKARGDVRFPREGFVALAKEGANVG